MIDVGLIGFGLAGKYFHAQVIHAVPGLRLAAILQRTGDQAAKAYPDARIVRTLDELLAIESLRLIVIATPNQTHFPFAKQCLHAGRDVVVDKPFTVNEGDALELFRIAKERGRLLTVFHSRRFDSDFQALRTLLPLGELGRVVRFEEHYDRFRPKCKAGAWREQPGPGSGVLFDLAPHLIDHALMLFGRPLAISADIRAERDGAQTDDAFDLFLEYPENLRVQLGATMLNISPRPRMLVLGTKGRYRKREFDPLENALRHGIVPKDDGWLLEKEEHWGEIKLFEGGESRRRRIASHGDWRDFYSNVRDALVGIAKPLVTPQQVLDVMVALELAQQSSAQKRVVPWRSFEVQD